jgi:hypothetical protein
MRASILQQNYIIYRNFTQKITKGVSEGQIHLDRDLDPNTIILYDEEGNMMDYIFYDPQSISTEEMWADKEVEVVQEDMVYRGKIIDIQDRQVKLFTGQRTILLTHYDAILADRRCENSIMTLRSLQTPKGYFTLSGLYGNITWSSQVQLLIHPHKQQGHLILRATISNPHQHLLRGQVSLVAGEVERVSSPSAYEDLPRASFEQSSVSPSPEVEMMRYELGEVENLQGQQIGVVLQQSLLKIETLYQTRWRTSVDNYLPVEYGYGIRTPFFIPSSIVSIYAHGSDHPLGTFLGQDRIRETQAQTQKRFFIGQTSRVVVEDPQEIQTPVQVADNTVLAHGVELTATIHNLTGQEITFRLRYDVGKDSVEDLSCSDSRASVTNTSRVGSDLVWTITTKQEKTPFECRFLLRHARTS